MPFAKGEAGTEHEHVCEGTAESRALAGLGLSAAGRLELPLEGLGLPGSGNWRLQRVTQG